jgi:PPK2 family polyphosphate:nucleotide phosphotransferase
MSRPFDSVIEDVAQRWAYWQPDVPYELGYDTLPNGQIERRRAGRHRKHIKLAEFNPAGKPFSLDNEAQDAALFAALAIKLASLQKLLWAEKRHKLLVVLQGPDTAGKEAVMRSVFGPLGPEGVRLVDWQRPTPAERDRDYLWRIHRQVPVPGEIAVFKRGHYADLLAPVVNGWITPTQHHQRIGHINDFERMLSHTGTVVIKLMLHISEDEQDKRRQALLEDPELQSKFGLLEPKPHKPWDAYQQAYEVMLSATHTPWAPWTIVPSNSAAHRNLMVATVLHQVLRNLDLGNTEAAPQKPG